MSDLSTVTGNVIARLLLLEPLAVTPATYATKQFVVYRSETPYWTNRPGPIQRVKQGGINRYTCQFVMRLWLAYDQTITNDPDTATNPQVLAWGYWADVMDYFTRYSTLTPPTFAPINGLASTEIACNLGLDLQNVILTQSQYLCIDFTLAADVVIRQG